MANLAVMSVSEAVQVFIVLWSVIDPIGTVPVFIHSTASMDAKLRRKVRNRAVLTAALVLFIFALFGQLVLEAMGIPLAAFQTAGGIVLFLFALTMIFGPSKPDDEVNLASNELDVAIYPIAMPSLASPGAILGIVMLTDNHRFSLPYEIATIAVMFVVLFFAWLLMMLADPIIKLIGNAGASLLSRVMGLVLSAVAANAVFEGIQAYFLGG